jgi:hypothetical protein
MRISSLVVAVGLGLGAMATASAADQPPTLLAPDGTVMSGTYKPFSVVRLDTLEALNRLQSANPRHYAIARKILAAAAEICDGDQAKVIKMKFDAQHVGCQSSIWMESNPPKRWLSFVIDDTSYSALVEVQLKVKVRPSDPAWAFPILRDPGR